VTLASARQQAWGAFDEIVARTDLTDEASNPWRHDGAGGLVYEPDFATLRALLGVPIALSAPSTSGVPALALDVWVAHELRRAGFDADGVWPRGRPPRVLPAPIANLLRGLPPDERDALLHKLGSRSAPKGVISSSAAILGKNYVKQVDVGISDWMTGPELLISTKRMDSSFGKNAANRVEESYGDAKNLRLRYPLAGLGFLYGLRSTVFDSEPDTAAWLIDLLQKLGREDDAYDAVCLLVVDYRDVAPPLELDDEDHGEDALRRALDPLEPTDADESVVEGSSIDEPVDVAHLPEVDLNLDIVPPDLQPSHFFKHLVEHVLSITPINFHVGARDRRASAR